MPNPKVSIELSAFAAACLIGVPLVPFAPPILGVWCYSLACRGQTPLSGTWQARVPLIVFAVLSGVCELCWGHRITDYDDVWFDNLFAGVIIPGSVACLGAMLVWIVREAGVLAYRHRHLGE